MLVCRNCCLCMDLRKGCIVIGYCQVVQQILLEISSLRELIENIHFFKTCSKILYKESSFILIYAKIVHVMLHMLYLILTVSLLVGLHKGKSRILKDYLVWTSLFLVSYAAIHLLALKSFNEFEMDTMGAPLSLPLNIYFLLMVRSYWSKMKTEEYLMYMNA